jgi:hypothetical protein
LLVEQLHGVNTDLERRVSRDKTCPEPAKSDRLRSI